MLFVIFMMSVGVLCSVVRLWIRLLGGCDEFGMGGCFVDDLDWDLGCFL